MEYLSIQDYTDKWNISKRRIQILCKEGRIPGAKIVGNMWLIPTDADRPNDARIKSPILEEKVGTSKVRKDLKKLLKDLYENCEARGIEVDIRKNYVLSLIANSLKNNYLGQASDSDNFSQLYMYISGQRDLIGFEQKDIDLVLGFVNKHCLSNELDSILSWAYQYSNKYINNNVFSQTQFFTEKYMIEYLVKNISNINDARKILDPCVGGGNFLVECFEFICDRYENLTVDDVVNVSNLLYGFDIDNRIARIAVINIRLKAISILKKKNLIYSDDIWNMIRPNIYVSSDNDQIQGSLSKEEKYVVNVIDSKKIKLKELLNSIDVVLTNPPFATIKGMNPEQKLFLKKCYPKSNCDTCVAFVEAIGGMLSENGKCGIVTQNSWMFLKTFSEMRNWVVNEYELEKIINLGSGAFEDLSGEKSNVALVIFSRKKNENSLVSILNVNSTSLKGKIDSLSNITSYVEKSQNELNRANGFDFEENSILDELIGVSGQYKDLAVPMQGTSTGNSKELVSYFWEHFNDSEWISVSNGGGYCRWKGLNNSVVKWGKDGEYIKAQKGSALRNVKYFDETQMVFSDTGTAGLNVRVLNDDQIFIASGPGIRVKKGNEFAHIALLNSRLASYCIRMMSPKLTIAAGYIGQMPANEKMVSSIVLANSAKRCIELKNKMLSTRSINLEYNDAYISGLPKDLDQAAWSMFYEDLSDELLKLEIEYSIDGSIQELYELSDASKEALDESLGKCAFDIQGSDNLDLIKLDKYLVKILDSNCCLKRTKNSKSTIGSDGILEYIAKDLNVNPGVIVRRIAENPFSMKLVIQKYKNLILHNFALYCMEYNTKNGVAIHRMSLKEMQKLFSFHFESFGYLEWLQKDFNRIHAEIFKGIPYLICKKGDICINDRSA